MFRLKKLWLAQRRGGRVGTLIWSGISHCGSQAGRQDVSVTGIGRRKFGLAGALPDGGAGGGGRFRLIDRKDGNRDADGPGGGAACGRRKEGAAGGSAGDGGAPRFKAMSNATAVTT